MFLLHESFDFSNREIAAIDTKTEQNCRQIERRARKHLSETPLPAPADPDQHDALLTRFLLATREGDLAGMVDLLAQDAVMYSDGGGNAQAARRPVHSAEHIARFMLGVTSKGGERWQSRLSLVNGRTGLVNLVDGQLFSIMNFDIRDGKIQNVFVMMNPDKLRHIADTWRDQQDRRP